MSMEQTFVDSTDGNWISIDFLRGVELLPLAGACPGRVDPSRSTRPRHGHTGTYPPSLRVRVRDQRHRPNWRTTMRRWHFLDYAEGHSPGSSRGTY